MTVRLALRRAGLGVLLLAMIPLAITSAWPSCEPHDSSASEEVDPGPTFGAEIALGIVGRGRVTSTPAGIDCPSRCFARVVLADPSVDGGDGGVTLVADETSGAHFVGWSLEELDLGVRARGPSRCSPMTRKSAMPSAPSSRVLTLPFGETIGTPPRGREEECADFTRVPVAYALTATFEEDFVAPGPDASTPDAGPDPLFQSPGSGPAKEIGVTSGYVYWRYEQSGLSGIASAFSGGSQVNVVVSPSDVIRLFDVDAHVAFQHANGVLQAIEAGNDFPVTLGNAPECAALASDFARVYCRANGLSGSTIYSWPISGAAMPTVVHLLPPGRDLAVDDSRFYFSDDKGGFTDQAIIESASRNGDGGVPFTSALVIDQTSPRNLVASSSYLFWLDDRGNGVFSARSALRSTPSTAQTSVSGTTVRFLAAEPFGSSYFIGIAGVGTGASTILRAYAGSPSSFPFRSNLTGLGGLAVDTSNVYFTQSNGRVYRVPTNDPRF